MPAAPGCAESAPLFRSHMPRLIGWRPVDTELPRAEPGLPPGPEAESGEVPPAMHQALHLCVVERFQPRRPFGGASKALYRL
ncbi:hypothetical protein CR162_10050 [Pseudoroseomonas rhizosphaerae]|uniref:Uncharacterized protein n=1 Tax=Teichococcus rhizosphaerae TaxID=1335062 RepID=A0A2C7ABQ1_9PROT|nr:hypothetical protein CR162_10050 [Pseudoroseomonas rhizosphaerae]